MEEGNKGSVIDYPYLGTREEEEKEERFFLPWFVSVFSGRLSFSRQMLILPCDCMSSSCCVYVWVTAFLAPAYPSP